MEDGISCRVCKRAIPSARIEHFKELGRGIDTCIKHSKEEPTIGLMIYGHKTAGTVVIIPKDEDGKNDPNTVDQAFRAYRRAR